MKKFINMDFNKSNNQWWVEYRENGEYFINFYDNEEDAYNFYMLIISN